MFCTIVSQFEIKCQNVSLYRPTCSFARKLATIWGSWVLITQYSGVSPVVPIHKSFNLPMVAHCSEDWSPIYFENILRKEWPLVIWGLSFSQAFNGRS